MILYLVCWLNYYQFQVLRWSSQQLFTLSSILNRIIMASPPAFSMGKSGRGKYLWPIYLQSNLITLPFNSWAWRQKEQGLCSSRPWQLCSNSCWQKEGACVLVSILWYPIFLIWFLMSFVIWFVEWEQKCKLKIPN